MSPTPSADRTNDPFAGRDPDVLRRLYRDMLRIRLVEEGIAEHYAEQEMRCPVHLSIGQEAAAVGACAALRPTDQIVSTHRCHSHYLAKGGDLDAMMGELYGRVTGCCGGRGGSMHLFDDAVGVMASVPIVASSIPLAVGAALAFRQRGEDNVAVAFLGDGSVEEGVFHESANFASLKKLPMIFFLENNLYAVYAHLAARQPDRPLADLAKAHGMATWHGDGNDVLAVLSATEDAAARARAGDGPTLIVVDTYRWREHCGPNYDNDIGYRTPEEFEAWKSRCPVAAFGHEMRDRGLLTDALDDALRAEIAGEITAAVEAAKAAPFPDADGVAETVYA